MLRIASVIACSLALAACVNQPPVPPKPAAPKPSPVLSTAGLYEITHAASAEGVGAAQGIFIQGNFVYILGDLNAEGTQGPGVIKEFFFSTDDDGARTLFPSNREIRLTDSGADIAPHPTGLTWHPNFGYWLGNTTDGVGSLFRIDFARAIRQGNLDGCVLQTIADDAAVDGTRPLFVELPGDRWVLATSDYGEQGNTLRLYDPVTLLNSQRTSETGVIVSETPCGPFVQSLASQGTPGQLWLVQNKTEGTGYRLTELMLDANGAIESENVISFDRPAGELEGMAWLQPDREKRVPFVMVSASGSRNIYFGRLLPPKQYVNPLSRRRSR